MLRSLSVPVLLALAAVASAQEVPDPVYQQQKSSSAFHVDALTRQEWTDETTFVNKSRRVYRLKPRGEFTSNALPARGGRGPHSTERPQHRPSGGADDGAAAPRQLQVARCAPGPGLRGSEPDPRLPRAGRPLRDARPLHGDDLGPRPAGTGRLGDRGLRGDRAPEEARLHRRVRAGQPHPPRRGCLQVQGSRHRVDRLRDRVVLGRGQGPHRADRART